MSNPDDTEPSSKTVQEELDKALALLVAERRANAQLRVEKDEALDRLRVRHTLQLEEAAAQLDAERKAKDEAVKKLKSVVAEINSDATLQARRHRADATATSVAPLDPDNPMVRKVGPNMLSHNTTINNCHTEITIHEEPQVLLEALLGDQTKVGNMLFQRVVGEGVAYWSFMEATKCCDLFLRMQVERQDEEEVVVGVESVDEEELESASLPDPNSTASKRFRLLLKEGTIVLRPLQFGQTLFTFTAQVDVGEVRKDAVVSLASGFLRPPIGMGSPTGMTRSTTTTGITNAITGITSRTGAAMKNVAAGEAAKASEFFCKLAKMASGALAPEGL
ncbi:hypothetical protein TrVE_jg5557 [Triparma verrucosa]|uniref:Uncharacterized protein n=1 Tax=Triparma verrucosa TaxID=1606542 RepID=A0A9W7BI89_9STRA|nr:hypothetical protein TrVE_jg5557 [Triparma verrucosa]